MPVCVENIIIRAPRKSRSRLNGTKQLPYSNIFLRASDRLRQERVVCIISCDSPVMATTINIPLKNCLKKFLSLTKSSTTNVRLRPLPTTLPTDSDNDQPDNCIILAIINIMVTISTSDCKASVNTMVLIPPRNVYNQIIHTHITTVSHIGIFHDANKNVCSTSTATYSFEAEVTIFDTMKNQAPVR